MRSSEERLISISCAQRSSGIFAIVRSRVTPALWTTTSTPPSAKCEAIVSGASSAVMSSGSASPPSASTTARRSALRLRHVEADDLGAVAAERGGDRRADPARGAGHQRRLAGQRQVPVDLRRRGDAFRHADHLAVDVGRARREQEAQGRLQLVLGARLDVDELRGRALAADLLGERAGEALQRPLRGVGAGGAGERRGGAEDDDAAAAAEPRHGGVEEALQLDQLGRVGDAGGVEDERLGLALGSGAFGADAVEDLLQRALNCSGAARGGAAQHRSGDDRVARLPAVEVDRLRQPHLPGDRWRRAAR